jgi:predicted nucleotidyltransferase component of viral defense system
MHTFLEELKQIKRDNADKNTLIIKSALKEYIQNYLLDFIYESKKYKHLIFYGGTCLRKIYNLDRMSEDIDFEDYKGINIQDMANDIEKYFKTDLKFPKVIAKAQKSQNISRVTVKFQVLYDIGLSNLQNENLHVKIEIREIPQKKFPTVLSPITISRFTILVKHYDLSTLMAGKMAACIQRVFQKGDSDIYVKGRDYYDVIWYMQQKIIPNKDRLLFEDKTYTIKKVFKLLDEKVKNIRYKDLYTDLAPLFLKTDYIKTWCKNFHTFYEKYRKYYHY